MKSLELLIILNPCFLASIKYNSFEQANFYQCDLFIKPIKVLHNKYKFSKLNSLCFFRFFQKHRACVIKKSPFMICFRPYVEERFSYQP